VRYVYFTQSREKRKKSSMHLSIAYGVLCLGSHGNVVAFRVIECLNSGLHSKSSLKDRERRLLTP
jgi:hypothetical protein